MDFGIIGVGGFVAPRHLQAIKDVGGDLKVALDTHDSVGILDRYFPYCQFFNQVERFDRHVLKNEDLEYISICSPNYLHESHCKLSMRLGANVICEKPLALTLENARQLMTVELQTKKKVHTILQLRLHPELKKLKEKIEKSKNRNHKVILDYVTPRGNWYQQSWKGKEGQSGGIETNIGIHFFDILIWLFGDVKYFKVHKRNQYKSIGSLEMEHADVLWNLSIQREDLPNPDLNFFRNMMVDGEQINFDKVFSELHTLSYKEIINGNGFGIRDAIKSIELVEKIRNIGIL